MARRNSRRSNSRSSRSSDRADYRRGRRKTEAESRVERITWFLLVMIFGIIYFIQDTSDLPNWFVPVCGAVILLGSGVYQYSRGWRVSPITWMGGSLMLALGVYGFYMNSTINLLSIALIIFAGVIGFGILTGET